MKRSFAILLLLLSASGILHAQTIFLDISNIPVGTTKTGRVVLSAAPAANVVVGLSVANTSYATADASATVLAGQTVAYFNYTGVSVGITSMVGSATGYPNYSRGFAAIPATPTFSPSAGTYPAGQTVQISSTSGTTIHYTLDGSTPTSSSPVYSSPITLGASETIKAYATLSGRDSSTGSAAYLVTGTSLAFYYQPSSVSTGATFNPIVSVKVVDANGNLVTSSATVNLALTTAGGSTLLGTASAIASGGVATFTGLGVSGVTTGLTLTATASGINSAVSTPFNVAPAPTSSYYVSNSGSDSNSGTSASSPWRTLAKLTLSIPTGSAAYLACGSVFREVLTVGYNGTSSAPLIYTAYGTCTPTTLPIVSAADLLSGWTAESEAGFTAYYASESGTPTLVFEDNHRLPIVSSKTSLTIGSSYIDTANHRVYVRSLEDADPTSHVVEASVRNYAIAASSVSHFRLYNLEADKSNSTQYASAIITGAISDIQVSNSIFNYSKGNGLYFSANPNELQSNILISSTTCDYNGWSGCRKGNGGDSIVMDHLTCNYNGFDPAQTFGGGCHFVSDSSGNYRPTNSGIRYSSGDYNGVNPDTGAQVASTTNSGVGIWCDTCGDGSFLLGNEAHGNTQAGIQLEFSGATGTRTMSYNVSYSNFYGVLHTRRSHNDVITNNTTWGNYVNCQFSGEYGGGETTVGMVNNTYQNNLCASQVLNTTGQVFVAEWGAENNSKGEGSGNVYRNNSFGVPTATNGVFAVYGVGNKLTSYSALDSAYGSSMNSMTQDPLLKDPAHGDFTLQPGSPAIGAGYGGVNIGAK